MELERNGENTKIELVLEGWEAKWEDGIARRVLQRKLKVSVGKEFAGRDRGMDIYVTGGDKVLGFVEGLGEREHQCRYGLDDKALGIMRKWIKTCVDGHEMCRGGSGKALPKRLVDVGEEGVREPFLVDCEDIGKVSQTVEYITLSHRWGEETAKSNTTSENLEDRKVAIHFNELSANFRDAIVTMRKLEVKYIWIDSICIVQDDDQDWEAEAPRMVTIYMNSLLTISAEGPGESDPSFLRPREVACPLPYEYYHPSLGHIEGNVWLEPLVPQLNFWIEYNTLRDRGWILQERFFPSRILHFSPYTTFWECRTQVAYEAYPEELERKRLHSEGFAEIWHTKNTFSQLLPLNPPIAQQPGELDVSGHYETWKWIVEAYSRTVLSWGSDRLPAISGMANHFMGILKDTYYAGIWYKDLPSGICWEPSPTHILKRPASDSYQAPSWSWASLDSEVRYAIKGDGKWESRIEVKRVHLESKGSNDMGELLAGQLKLRGKIIRCEVRKIPSTPGFVTIVLDGRAINLMDIMDEGMRDYVWCLWVMEDVSKLYNGSQGHQSLPHGRLLLLEEVDGRDLTFRRVGVIMYSAGLPHWTNIEASDITII